MITQIILVVLIALAFILVQRRRMRQPDAFPLTANVAIGTDVPIDLQLVPLAENGTAFRWSLLTHTDGARTSQLRVGYEPIAPSPGQSFVFTTGWLQPVAGSNPAPLMGALADIHGSIDIPVAAPSTEALRIDVAILGTALSAGAAAGNVIAGAFNSATPGDWTVLKLFVHGEEEDSETGEIFLALNETARTAQFLLKDPEYWPMLAPRFARVLAGTPA